MQTSGEKKGHEINVEIAALPIWAHAAQSASFPWSAVAFLKIFQCPSIGQFTDIIFSVDGIRTGSLISVLDIYKKKHFFML